MSNRSLNDLWIRHNGGRFTGQYLNTLSCSSWFVTSLLDLDCYKCAVATGHVTWLSKRIRFWYSTEMIKLYHTYNLALKNNTNIFTILWTSPVCVLFYRNSISQYRDQNMEHCFLTHRGRVTHICVIKLTIIGSDNGLSPDRRQAIIRTNAGILSIWHLRTNFSEILIKIQNFSFMKMHLKM